MLNLTLEQQTEVARIVTQQPWKYLHGHVILDGDEKLHYWNPSLTGEDWQLAQACRVIVAASELPQVMLTREAGKFSISFHINGQMRWGDGPDLLQASAHALLSTETLPGGG